MRTTSKALLVDDDRHAEVFNRIRVGLRILGQKVANEEREVFVKLPLRFGRQCIKNNGRFPRSRNAREDGQLALGNLQRNVFEIVFTRAADGDELGHARIQARKFGMANRLS